LENLEENEMTMFFNLLRTSLGCACVFVLCACASTPSARFYELTAIAKPGEAGQSEKGISLGIGPVELAEYLERPQIVNRISPHEVSVSEFDRWAEPLKSNFVRVVADNLSILLGTDRVHLYPWRTSAVMDCRVAILVTRLDGAVGGISALNAYYKILSGDGKKMLAEKKVSFSEPAAGQGFDALVLAQSRAIASLSQAIARDILALLK
jgi:uncharacterized lipoprotein YmbA